MSLSIQELRQRVLNGDTVSPEEYNQIITQLRGDRYSSAGKKAEKAPAAPLPENLNDLFS